MLSGSTLTRLLQFAIVSAVVGAGAHAATAPSDARLAAGLGAGVACMAALVAVWLGLRRLFAFPADEYGPRDDDRARFDAHCARVRKVNRNLVERWKVQGSIRAAFARASEARTIERAEAHLSRANEIHREWSERFRVPRGERRALERRFRADWDAASTTKYVTAVRAQVVHASELKTERGRERALERAHELLGRGMTDPRADHAALAALARELGLEEASPAAEAPEREPPTGKPADTMLAAREAPPAARPARWVPPGESVEIGGRAVTGPLYVGGELAGPLGAHDSALVDPELAVARRATPAGRDLGRRPSYAALSPAGRAAYLAWLAAESPGEGPSLFARMLLAVHEQRLLVEGAAAARAGEIPRLVERLERIARERAGDRKVRKQALDLARWAAVRHPYETSSDAAGFELDASPGVPMALTLSLARRLANGTAVPAGDALAWWRATSTAELPLAARRAPANFERLFRARYRERFGEGLVASPGAEPLRALVRPSSGGLGDEPYRAALDLPDPAGARGAIARLEDLAKEVADELSAYVRGLRGQPDLRTLALLPRELLDHHDEPVLDELRTLLREFTADASPAFCPVKRLLALWPGRTEVRPGKGECARYATLLAHLGYGVEPDVRFGGAAWRVEDDLALYRLASDAPHAPSRAYEAATLIVHVTLALTTASDDGARLAAPEEDALREHLESSLDLDPAERRRLEVHLAWRLRHPPRATALRQRIERLDRAGRDRLADFLLRVTFADGMVTPEEVRFLEKLYPLLGRDPSQLHTDLHARTGAAPPAADGGGGLALDPSVLRAKIAETRRVSALLGDIFADEDEATSGLAADSRSAPDGPTYAGLDAAHSALLAALAERDVWSRADLEELTADLELLVDGALDALNDAALDAVGDPLWEGEDPLEVDVAVAREMMNAGASKP